MPHEKTAEETSARNSMDALDELSHTLSDDLERLAHLLGEQRIPDRIRKLHVIQFLPGSLLQFSGSWPSSGRRDGPAFLFYTAVSGEWRYLLPNRNSFREAIQVALHDLHLSKHQPPPRKFNGAQQIAYTSVILMGAGSLLTGLSIYRPVQFAWLTTLLGGYEWARWEHFWLAIGYVLFFLVHIAQVIRAGWNNFRAMVTGYEVVSIEPSTTEGSELQS
jgi:hypothetical protein